MTLIGLGARNVLRHPLRTCLTLFAVAVAVLTFVLLRTVVTTWDLAAEIAAKDRIATRHKLSFVIPLPKHYVDTIQAVPGVQATTWMSWFGGKDARHPELAFASFAVDAPSFLKVFDELTLPPEQQARWLENRQGAIIGPQLARQLGLAVGDRLPMTGSVFPGDWVVEIEGIFGQTRKSFDPGALLLHWDYLNQSLPTDRRDQVGWVTSRVDSPGQSAQVAAAIDGIFDSFGHRTRTMSERELNLSFVARFSSLMKAIQGMCLVILLILTLVLGNTIAMGVRERSSEYGALRALGFPPSAIRWLILGESTLLGGLAGALGVGAGAQLVNGLLSPYVEANLGGVFPYFRLDLATALWALALALGASVLAGVLPALSAARLSPVDALRRVE
jgi:putative ABC transport system permease protein